MSNSAEQEHSNNVASLNKPAELGTWGYFLNYLVATNKTINIALRVYRFASLFLTSLIFFMIYSPFTLYGKLSLFAVLLFSALLLVYLYERFQENLKIVFPLTLLELIGVSFLLAYTGGMESPFMWYALNPLILAAVCLPAFLVWVFLGGFLLFALREAIFYAPDGISFTSIIDSGSSPVLTLIIILIVMQIFARAYSTFSEHSYRAELQQKELFTAYQDLSDNYQVIQGLSTFQKEAMSYNDAKDILINLTKVVLELFPFQQTAVILPQEKVAKKTGNPLPFQVITPENKPLDSAYDYTLKKVQQRWSEFGRIKSNNLVVSEKREWVAVPLRDHNQHINAVFLAWLKPKANPFSFADNLYLFVNFAEQAMQRLHIFQQNEQTLNHLSSLYSAVETISSRNTPQEVIDLFAAYGRAMTGCDKIILWIEKMEIDGIEQPPVYSVKGKRKTFPEDEWQETLLEVWSKIRTSPQPIIKQLTTRGDKNSYLIGVPVKSEARCFGVLCGIHSKEAQANEYITHTLSILGDLTAIAVERNLSELFDSKLLLLDEQNRIAGEIHDTISQNIFSIVYGIDALSKEAEEFLNQEHQQRLFSIRNLASETARELRLLIYRLSPRKRGDDTFLKEITGYLEEVARLNQITIKFNYTGKDEYLNQAIRKAVYRIVKEATGNAMRHGQSKEIEVKLEMNPFRCLLVISDNGKGFKASKPFDLYGSRDQLGLVNMRELAISLQGNLTINSEPGKGTRVTCSFPTSPLSQGKASS